MGQSTMPNVKFRSIC